MQGTSGTIRWGIGDQGRGPYLRFPNLVREAQTVVAFDGRARDTHVDAFGAALRATTGESFGPIRPGYDVWRNYARFFMATLLAALDARSAFAATDVARALATGAWSVDEYLEFLAKRMYFPSQGITSSYTPGAQRVWPISVLLRYLSQHGAATLDDIGELLISNSFVGDEPPGAYTAPTRHAYTWGRDEKRQLREFIAFVGQFSFLRWNGRDTLSVVPGIAPDYLLRIATPDRSTQLAEPNAETVRLGTIPIGWVPQSAMTPNVSLLVAEDVAELSDDGAAAAPDLLELPADEDDREFVEGEKAARIHLRTERDPALRAAFLAQYHGILSCDVCGLKPARQYPWLVKAENLIEIHHRLPLSSVAHTGATVLLDVSPLCPSCHKAVHRFYSTWLSANELADFPDKETADLVYEEAKRLHVRQAD